MKLTSCFTSRYSWSFCLGYFLIFFKLYYPAYSVMVKSWSGENYTYCYFVLPISGYLLWEKRRELRFVPKVPSWTGLTLVLPAIFLYWLGELGGEYYTLYFSSWLLIVGLCLLHLGWQKLKVMFFSLCFSLAMFPLPNMIFNNVSLELKLLSSRIGLWMLQLIGMEAYREGNIIDLGFTKLQVIDACSGLRYLIPLLVLGVLQAHYFRAPFWQRCLLVISTIPLTIITNSLRIASVGFLYQFWGPRVAEGFFHDFSGWLIFMASLALLLGEMWLLKTVFPQATDRIEEAESSSTLEIDPETVPGRRRRQDFSQFALVLLLLGTTLMISHTVQFREKVPLCRPLIQFPLEFEDWHGTRSAMEQQVIDALKLSDYLLADYRNAQGQLVSLYVAYNESQRKGESTHSPGSCLPGSGWVFQKSGRAPLFVDANTGLQFKVNRAFMQKGGERMLIYYWFPQRGRMLTNMLQLKLYAFWDALTRQRTDGGMVRLITPVNGEDPANAETRLIAFTQKVMPLLQKFIPN